MANALIYNSCAFGIINQTVNFYTDSFKMMLLDGSYVPNKDTDTVRANVTGEITATNYVPGGNTVYATPSLYTPDDREILQFSDPVFANVSDAVANSAVIYKDTGDSNTDILIAYIDFGQPLLSSAGQFAVVLSGQMYIQN